jgi:capsular exopolysaccharide synthesis family protein
VGVTSAQPGDGKSTISLNLAYSLAELGKKTLLVDADLRRASIHEKLGLERVPGLSELIRGNINDISASVRRYSSTTTQLEIIPSGEMPENPSELLNSERCARLFELLSQAYDFIVVDLPPIGAVVDAVSVAQELDGMLVVIRENACPRGLLNECMQQLNYANVNILGFVVNGAMEGSGKKYQYGSYSYY